jgi:peptide deformylase
MLHIVPVEEIPSVAQDVPTSDLMQVYKTCLQMENVCMKENGIGLSAVQVGVPWKLFIVRQPDNEFDYYLNTEYEPLGDEKATGIEGCLSLRGKDGELRYFEVSRFKKVRIKGQKLTLKPSKVEGLEAVSSPVLSLKAVDFTPDDAIYPIVFQHEIDHHHNILISQIGTEIELR